MVPLSSYMVSFGGWLILCTWITICITIGYLSSIDITDLELHHIMLTYAGVNWCSEQIDRVTPGQVLIYIYI
jgi:hypothetical protein